jgi:putative alpha-1,2-mannosidase
MNTWISQNAITSGGELKVTMGEKPMVRIIQENELPHSMSAGRD